MSPPFSFELLVVLPWLLPLVALLPLGVLAARPRAMALLVLFTAAGSGLAVIVLALTLLAGPAAGAIGSRIELWVPAVVGHLYFAVDAISVLLMLLTSLLWSAASWYALGYLHGPKLLRYHRTSLIALSAILGLFAAGDLLTLYLFFEWLGLSATLFVLHSGGTGARHAAIKYLAWTLLGGFAVLSGALIAQGLGGGVLHAPLQVAAEQVGLANAAALLLVIGFGVKAGVVALYLWLPDAHTAAPASASALLSGLMIKAGAYGILRSVGGLFVVDPTGGALLAGRVAEGVIALGVVGMALGVAMALLQVEAKRLLAYSSVSQMGFILVGIGSAAYLAEGGAVGWLGALLHIVSHALLKGLLFLAVGGLVAATGSGDLRHWGGLARRMPISAALLTVGALGLAGFPGLAGFVSKSLLHHALEYAEALHGAGGLRVAEAVFSLSAVGTAAVMWKLCSAALFRAPRSKGAADAREVGSSMRAGMGLLAFAGLLVGWRPELLAPLLTAGIGAFGVNPSTVFGTLSAAGSDAADLRSALSTVALGAPLAWAVQRARLSPAALPTLLSLDRWVVHGWLLVARALTPRFTTPVAPASGGPAVALEQLRLERELAEDRFAVLARTRIARLSRDLNLNLAVLFLVWFAFLWALFWRR